MISPSRLTARHILSLTLLGSAVLGAASAPAMVVVQRDFPALVAHAEQIVAGTVTGIQEQPGAAGAPWTLVTFTDLIVVKGAAGDTFTLRLYGGTSDGRMVRIPDMPAFAVGDRAVLFVAGNGRDLCPLVGVWQGRFRVRVDPVTGREIVASDAGRPLTGVAGGQLLHGQRGAAATEAGAMALSEFLERVADEMAHPPRQPSAD
jgi:hypothetical protein